MGMQWGFTQAWKPAPHRQPMPHERRLFYFRFASLSRCVKDALISDHGAHTPTVGAVEVAAVPVGATRTEVEVAGAVRVAWILRGRPVSAELASVVEAAVPAVASSGQEDGATVGTRETHTIYAILRCPFRTAIIQQFIYLV